MLIDITDITESSVVIVNVDDDNHGAPAANCGVYDKFVQSSSSFNHGFSIPVMVLLPMRRDLTLLS